MLRGVVWCAAGAVAALAGAAGTAEALTLESLTLAQRAAAADRVVRGRVLSTEGVASKEFGVETRVIVAVDETFKGEAGERLTFTIPGGTKDGRTSYVPGMPDYQPEHEVVLFLQTLPDGTAMPVGLPLGSFHVVRSGGGARLLPDADSTRLDGEDGGPAEEAAAGQPLEKFLGAVRAAVHEAGPGHGKLSPGRSAPADVAPRTPVAGTQPKALEAPGATESDSKEPAARPGLLLGVVVLLIVAALALTALRARSQSPSVSMRR